MVVYLSKRSDAQRFLQEGFFSAGGESGYTKIFDKLHEKALGRGARKWLEPESDVTLHMEAWSSHNLQVTYLGT